MVHDDQVRYALSLTDGSGDSDRPAIVIHADKASIVVEAPTSDGWDEGRGRERLQDVMASVAQALPELFGRDAAATSTSVPCRAAKADA